MPHFAEMVYQLGGIPALAGIPYGPLARYFFVDSTNGSDSNDGLSLDHAKATIAAAEDLTTGGRHDCVIIVGTGSNTLSAQLLWDKAATHLIGICAPTHMFQRARIFQLSTLDTSPLLSITAEGCIFRNFYIFQGVNDADSLINVQITGARNYFENVHFAGGGHATQAVDGGCSLRLNGGHENTFRECSFGVDTINAATGMGAIRMAASSSKNFFKECIIQLRIGHNNAVLIEVEGTRGVDSFNWFQRCQFISNSPNRANTMASAFVIPASHSTSAVILLDNCSGFGFTDWEDGERDIVYLTGGTATKGGYTGLYQVNQNT